MTAAVRKKDEELTINLKCIIGVIMTDSGLYKKDGILQRNSGFYSGSPHSPSGQSESTVLTHSATSSRYAPAVRQYGLDAPHVTVSDAGNVFGSSPCVAAHREIRHKHLLAAAVSYACGITVLLRQEHRKQTRHENKHTFHIIYRFL